MYNGGKNGEGVYHTIINQIPPHDIYIELFLGSGAIIRNKKRARIYNIGVELDAGTIDKFHQGARYKVENNCAISFLKEAMNNHTCCIEPDHRLKEGFIPLLSNRTFIYCDPPYPFSSRRSSNRKLYKNEMTDAQHTELLKLLLTIPADIAISSYANPIYNTLLKGWRIHDFPAMTRQGIATERLYMNYAAPTVLHDYSFLGSNFTQRQRIKRKINRHVTRLQQLPILERNAILAALSSIDKHAPAAAQIETAIVPAE